MQRVVDIYEYLIDNTVSSYTELTLDKGIHTKFVNGLLKYNKKVTIIGIDRSKNIITIDPINIYDILGSETVTVTNSTGNDRIYTMIKAEEVLGNIDITVFETVKDDTVDGDLSIIKRIPIIDIKNREMKVTVLDNMFSELLVNDSVSIVGSDRDIENIQYNIVSVELLVPKLIRAKTLSNAARVTFCNLLADGLLDCRVGRNLSVHLRRESSILPRYVKFDNESFGNYIPVWYEVPVGGRLLVENELDKSKANI